MINNTERLLIKVIFHSSGEDRNLAKYILDKIGNVKFINTFIKKILYSKSKNIKLFFAPRYEKIKYIQDKKDYTKLHTTVVMMVRNEHDRMHDIMRHLCSLFDRIENVIDHHSDDDTSKIALAYQNISNTEVIVLRGMDEGYYQSEYMTACANALIQENKTDWLFFLDADEFLPFHDAQDFQNALTQYSAFPFIHMPWRNIALKKLDPETVQGAEGIIGPSSHLAKTAIHVPLVQHTKIIVNPGNHTVSLPNFNTKIPTIEAFNLYHIPILGKKALEKKVTQGIQAYEQVANKRQSMGFHWREISNDISEITSNDDLIKGVAIDYSNSLSSIISRVIDGTIMNGCEDITISISQTNKSYQENSTPIPSFSLKDINDVMNNIFSKVSNT